MKSPSDVTRRHPVERLSRSEVMSRIRSKNTAPELLLRRALSARKLRYRLHHRVEGIRADIVFRAAQVILEIDGCFWHGCPEHYVRPRGTGSFWDRKLRANIERDRRQSRQLLEAGWTLIRLWEHIILEDADGAAQSVLSAIKVGDGGNWQDWRVVRVTPLEGTGNFERRYLETLSGDSRRQEDSRRITAKVGRVDRKTRLNHERI